MAALPSRRQRIQEALKSPYVRAVLDMIAAAEIGQDANNAQRGYNVAFGKNATFDSYAAHPGVRGEYIDKQGQRRTSSAAGRYQFLEGTVRDLQKRYGFSDFSPQTQDEMAVALMMDAGALDDILRGDLNAALPKLGTRWASLHTSEAGRRLHGTRSPDFVYSAYNSALAKYSNGAPVEYPAVPSRPGGTGGTAQPQGGSGTNRPVLAPGSFSTAVPSYGMNLSMPQMPEPVGDVRSALNQRYARRRMAIAPGPLTPETGAALTQALLAPQPGTPIHQYPSYHIDEPTLVRQPAVDRNSTGVQMVPTGAPATASDPNGPLDKPEFFLEPPQMQAAANPAFQVLPMDAQGNVVQPTGTTFDAAMAELLADPRAQVPTVDSVVPPLTGVAYLEQQLQKAQGTPADFLNVAALDMPYRDELLALIDATPVPAIG